MPPLEVVRALEMGAVDSKRPAAYRYYSSTLRAQLAKLGLSQQEADAIVLETLHGVEDVW